MLVFISSMTMSLLQLTVLLVMLIGLSLGCSTYRAAQLYQTGTASIGTAEPTKAVADLERAVRLAPHASQIRNHLGIAYVEVGRFRDAIQAFEYAVLLDCDNSAAFQNLKWAEKYFAVVSKKEERR